MAVKKCECGTTFEDDGFKTKCIECFKKQNGNGNGFKNGQAILNGKRDIHRQVFLKIAGRQKIGSAKEVVSYAKALEKEFDRWNKEV